MYPWTKEHILILSCCYAIGGFHWYALIRVKSEHRLRCTGCRDCQVLLCSATCTVASIPTAGAVQFPPAAEIIRGPFNEWTHMVSLLPQRWFCPAWRRLDEKIQIECHDLNLNHHRFGSPSLPAYATAIISHRHTCRYAVRLHRLAIDNVFTYLLSGFTIFVRHVADTQVKERRTPPSLPTFETSLRHSTKGRS